MNKGIYNLSAVQNPANHPPKGLISAGAGFRVYWEFPKIGGPSIAP